MDDFLGRDVREDKSSAWTSHHTNSTPERAQREPQTMLGICRICRGEGDEHDPLYHPCRCSGSIQHVHQNCLMDWLAHSQKKYCELCKTPYRFTKYYDPKMPDHVPILVFVDRVSRYVLENSLNWLRGFIACSFWLIALPDVRFLRSLTRSPQLNQCLINILEGQILTIVAMVSFILVILVRDYVVQQQPELLNIRAGLLDAEQPAQPRVAVEPAQLPLQDGNESDTPDDVDPGLYDPPPNEDDTAQGHMGAAEGHGAHRAVNVFADGADFEEPQWAEDTGSNNQSSDSRSSGAVATPDCSQSESNADLDILEYTHGRPWMASLDDMPRTNDTNIDAGPSRPRSVSDGPQVQANINPLANNTWSFDAGSSASQDSGRQHIARADTSDGAYGAQPNVNEVGSHEETGSDEEAHESPLWQGATRNSIDLRREPPTPSSSHATEPDTPQPPPAANRPVKDRVADFMWADIDNSDQAAVDAVVDLEDDPDHAQWRDMPLVDEAGAAVGDNGHNFDEPDHGPHLDFRAADRAADADADDGLDPEAIEDMEDFEGVMELLGMRGPITNLFQNVIFCAILVQAALFGFVFVPFNLGRITIWMLARPVRIVRIFYGVSIVLQDFCFLAGGFVSWVVFNLVDMFTMTRILGDSVAGNVVGGRKISYTFFVNAASRIWDFSQEAFFDLSATDHGMRYWSAISREALISIRKLVVSFTACFVDIIYAIFNDPTPLRRLLAGLRASRLQFSATNSYAYLSNWKEHVANIGAIPHYEIKLLDLRHATWSTADITWAILAGYLTLFGVAALYHKFSTRRARTTAMGDIEATIIDVINQASGIMKVITIISIEMLVFPLYCGMLLDCALLPLFKDTSIASRWLFTYQSPWTSLFIHWFVGTGYMFHFALFVSMCRKIMRPGVLYFIRDPDDPEFHPVRDVLERNLINQLRKIMFSALVYGGLVIVCLGGVVWGLAAAAPGILPIHYSSNEPVLEFPVDLLFYNFFMPLAFRLLKPGNGLQLMYKWCFRKSARILRLTNFIFGERRIDEEGVLYITADSKHRNASVLRKMFVGLDSSQLQVIPNPLSRVLDGVDTNPPKLNARETHMLRDAKGILVRSGQLVPDGRFVKAPASDRVKIMKPTQVFLPVDDRGRLEGGRRVEGLHGTADFKTVYIPPWFRTRIFLFIMFIWTFAAVTGVSLTIIPLVLGRMMFKMVLPSFVRTNDIYAFCIEDDALPRILSFNGTYGRDLEVASTDGRKIGQSEGSVSEENEVLRPGAAVA
ncbi:ERAD-associated E3 ubiquitin-protein ligase-like protein [Emericellopsis cladophorae]|uniref:RING-type E3 ubiquitin transferase n=1 Tax=Emericellopsis cladophorae TaxID=2686198 RepID=A0A9P9Y8L3_9HYPO|nr:ERAD-associated E3 ubiquitin-protein ligase-like protein [Emericellopsis cladophorae]KAI6785358.1 ERAD-associated E3 ubiquitin-protein ligase-like protein [Emericellopsis cladophorae]